MVKEIKIQNYKSVQDLTLELGRINVLIGANGCGKSNILEAIAFGSAAAEDKLDKEFLSARGIRVTDPKAMKSGFDKKYKNKDVVIEYESTFGNNCKLFIENDGTPYTQWKVSNTQFVWDEDNDHLNKEIEIDINLLNFFEKYFKKSNVLNQKLIVDKINSSFTKGQIIEVSNFFKNLSINVLNEDANLFNFLIYAPENTYLRKFEDEERTSPLGIRGEGLFDLLNEMNQNQPEEFQEIIENLELIDWFDGFEIPKDLVFTERRIRIKDRFLEEGLQYFDQRSSNEGFLFLMFYFALFISKYTPKFFAIDNIDASLNPKLCIELIKILTKLAKKHDKQVIFTTHNPAILDGLNLNDDEVRLLVVNRNIYGHTKVKRVLKKEMPEGVEPLRLSEQFLRGYLGGLPKNF